MRTHWTALHLASLAAAAPQGRHLVAARSGHAIRHQQPRLAADAIPRVIPEHAEHPAAERHNYRIWRITQAGLPTADGVPIGGSGGRSAAGCARSSTACCPDSSVAVLVHGGGGVQGNMADDLAASGFSGRVIRPRWARVVRNARRDNASDDLVSSLGFLRDGAWWLACSVG